MTHSLSFLSQSDEIILLDNGKIEDKGSYVHLLKHNQIFQDLMHTFTQQQSVEQKNNKYYLTSFQSKFRTQFLKVFFLANQIAN